MLPSCFKLRDITPDSMVCLNNGKIIFEFNQTKPHQTIPSETPTENKEIDQSAGVEAFNVLPTPTITPSVKRQREAEDDDGLEPKRKRQDDENIQTLVSQPTQEIPPLENVTLPPAPSPPPTPSLSQTNVEITDNRKRDMGFGADDDALKAAERESGGQQTVLTQPGEQSDAVQVETQPTSPFPNKCDVCGKVVKTVKGLKIHKKRMHFDQQTTDSPPPQEQGSRKRSLDQDDLDSLSRKKSRENAQDHCFCKICGKHFRSARLFDKHVVEAHVNVEPEQIENVLENDKNLEDRQRKNQKKAQLNKTILAKKKILKESIIDDESDDENQTQQTNEIKRSFTRKKNIQRAAAALDKNLVTCNLCKNTFKSDKELKNHIISTHAQRFI